MPDSPGATTSEDYTGAVIVIPTRNRASLAMNAIRSVLEQAVTDFQVLVSDNSISEKDKNDLERFCSALNDRRLSYVRPPKSLSMTAHWEWVIQYALSSYRTNHFLYLTDRMMFKPRALKEVLDRAAVYSNKILSYNHDRIIDEQTPIRIEQHLHTGKLLEIKTLRLSYLYSQGMFPHSLPRMLNCIVPRSILERIQQRFGNVFDSVAPDFNFCCRCLEIEDSILYYDKAPIFHYAGHRSNGASESRGEMTPDYVDFRANLVQGAIRNHATPIPELATGINAVFHEYLALKQATNSPRFFDLNLQRYLQVNAEDARHLVDPARRSEMEALLEAHGLEVCNGTSPTSNGDLGGKLSSKAAWRKLRSTLRATLVGPWTQRGWIFVARNFGINPPDINAFAFDEIGEAIDYVKSFPRSSQKDWPWQEELLEARQLPFSD